MVFVDLALEKVLAQVQVTCLLNKHKQVKIMLLPTVGYFLTYDSFTYLYYGLQFGAIKLIPDTALACTSKARANSF